MVKSLDSWLNKSSSKNTKRLWKSRWYKFAEWITTNNDQFTKKPFLVCNIQDVDDIIKQDFQTLSDDIFQNKYYRIINEYAASLSDVGKKTSSSLLSSVKSFFMNETVALNIKKKFGFSNFALRLNDAKAFAFFISIGNPTGVTASSLIEFLRVVEVISITSLRFHLYRGDFENWFKYVWGYFELSDEINILKTTNFEGESLRNKIHDTVSKFLKSKT